MTKDPELRDTTKGEAGPDDTSDPKSGPRGKAAAAPTLVDLGKDAPQQAEDDADETPDGPRQGGNRRPNKGGGNKGGKPGRRNLPKPAPVVVKPFAGPARMQRRHWGLVLSFVLMVIAPLAGTAFYLWTYAQDQYVSTTGFTVRSKESGGATDLLGGLAQFAGGSNTASDSDILYKFIQSQQMVASVDEAIDLRAHYTQHWPEDWVFSLWPEASMEDLVWYWQRIVGISYDSGTGLIEMEVRAFDPQTAQDIANRIVEVSQDQINALNARARDDAMRYALSDLDAAVAKLKEAREALTRFRTRTKIVDPEADIQSRLGVMANLQQQLAQALIEYDLLRQTASGNDPRLTKAEQRIDVIRERIMIERQTFASDNTETGAVGEDYPSLIAEFESLSVDREYAEESYRAALTALSVARDDAARQSRYLATYVKPTLAQDSEYPDRVIVMGLVTLFLILFWSISALIYYSIRDRS